jgi:hypothetical protein
MSATATATTAAAKGKWKQITDNIPTTSKVVGIIILILNIFFPGVGTMLLACIGGSFVVEHLVIGLLQFFTAFLIIGWIWSIYWGILVMQKSN